MTRPVLVLILFLTAAFGCGEGRAVHPDASSLFSCASNADCDDGIPCTSDNCDVSNVCQHQPVDPVCTGAGEHCVVGVGCTTVQSCTDASMCNDGLICTLDTCDVGNVCGHQPIDSFCADPTPVCDATQGCVAGTPAGCTSAADCPDGVDCTVDSCGVDMMCHHMPVDSICPAGQACDPAMGCIEHHGCATAADCTPAGETWWNFCDGDPMCDTEFGCSFPTARDCHDTDPCTVDSCDRTMGVNGACLFVCDSSQPSCNCPGTAPTCAGTFQLTPAPVGHCVVAWDLSTIEITNTDGAITVRPVMLSTAHTMDTGAATATCPSFTASSFVGGACTETYTIDVTFTDDDHLTGTFQTDFSGTLCLGCRHNSYTFNGTRI